MPRIVASEQRDDDDDSDGGSGGGGDDDDDDDGGGWVGRRWGRVGGTTMGEGGWLDKASANRPAAFIGWRMLIMAAGSCGVVGSLSLEI